MNKKDLLIKWQKEMAQHLKICDNEEEDRTIIAYSDGFATAISIMMEDIKQLNEVERVPPEDSDSSPSLGLIEQLWDEHSELIEDDIDSLSFWAGRLVINRENFFKALSTMRKGDAPKS